nr:hypothetical protein [uncultured Marinobacter sp.]
MRVKISTTYQAPAGHVWALVKRSGTLLFVCKGLLGFAGAERFPEEWSEGETVVTRLLFFGFIPAWQHTLTFQEVSDRKRVLYTKEGGGLVPIWKHFMQVSPGEKQTCTYIDDVEIRAGVFTLLVWLYAHIFYRYRQLRWRALLRRFPHQA